MKTSPTGIVVDGAHRLAEAKNYAQVKQALKVAVTRRHAAERAGASFWRRFRIDMTVHREIREELQKQFPPGALHLIPRFK